MKVTCALIVFFLFALSSCYAQLTSISVDSNGIILNDIVILHQKRGGVFTSNFTIATLESALRDCSVSYRKKKTKEHLEYRIANSTIIFYFDLSRNRFVMGQLDFEKGNNAIAFSAFGINITRKSKRKNVCESPDCVYCKDTYTNIGTVYQYDCTMYGGNFTVYVNFSQEPSKGVRFINFYFF